MGYIPTSGRGNPVANPQPGGHNPNDPTALPGTPTAGAQSQGGGPVIDPTNVPQAPSFLGTGQFTYQPYPINDQAITGNPALGAGQNYGLNNVWGAIQNQIGNLGSQGAQMATAPQGNAAQFQAATGSAAQGQAAAMAAAQGQAALANAAQGGYATGANTNISTAGDASFQGQQQSLANQLAATAGGYGGPSPADLQLKQGMDQNVASQLAVLGSQRGNMGNAALAARSAADQGAAANAQLNQQMGIQRAQETLNAQNSLGNVLGTARGQAQNYNVNQANLNQGMTQFNAGNAQAAQMQNAQFAQQSTLANQAASNSMGLANLAAMNNANEFNAGNSQAMNLANMGAQNQFGLSNLAAMNAANAGNAQFSQQMGMQNLGLAGQYGLANQQTQLANAQLYDQELNAMLGAQTGIGESNRAAALADQQLQLQQALGAGQINEQGFQAAAQANANLAGSVFGAIGGVGTGLYNAFSGMGGGGGGGGGAGGQAGGYVGSNPGTPDTSGAGSSVSGGAGSAGSSAGDNLFDASSDRTNKTAIRDESGDVVAKLQRARGDARTSPYAETLRRASRWYASSDENLKEGIEGGNPMLDSYLREYHDATKSEGNKIDVGEGLGFHDATYATSHGSTAGHASTGAQVGSSVGGAAGGALGGAALGAAAGSVVPGVGTVIGGALGAIIGGLGGSAAGGAVGNAVDPSKAGSPTSSSTMLSQGSGITGESDIGKISEEGSQSDDPFEALSDDNEKAAVMSGNRGMQAFLQQANAQTNAQNGQGASSNAFMQQGQPPSAQVDRQFSPWMVSPGGNPNMGYGAPQQFMGPGMVGGAQMGSGYGGGMSQMGGYSPGGVTAAPPPNPGGFSGASLASQAPWWENQPAFGGMAVNPNAGALSSPSAQLAAPPPAAGAPHAMGASNALFQGASANHTPTNGGAGIMGASLSDENEKTGEEDDPKKLQEMLDHLHAYSYRYKDPSAPGAAPGRRIGVMAQDLEKSPLGSRFVEDTDDGKVVNYGQMMGTHMAALAYLNERANEHDRMIRDLAAST